MDPNNVDNTENIIFGLSVPKIEFTVDDSCDVVFNVVAGVGMGTFDHDQLNHRDLADQHPMDSITGLVAALEGHTHPSAAITDFQSAVSGNSDVADNSTARHDQAHLWNGADHTSMPATFPPATHGHDHGELTGVTEDDHHDRFHEIGGPEHTGKLSHFDLEYIDPNDHHLQLHEINGPDHSGSLSHSDLANITADNHHLEVHAISGSEHTGQLAHSDIAGQTVDDHHLQVHDIGGSDHTGNLVHGDLGLVTEDQHHPKIHGVEHSSGGTDDISGVFWDKVNLTPGSAGNGDNQVPVWDIATETFIATPAQTSLTLVGSVATYGDLPAGPHPNGYAWITEDTGDTWMWSVEEEPDAFVNLGTIFSTRHDALTNVLADQHHPQAHAHNGVDSSGFIAHANLIGVGVDDHHAETHPIDGVEHTGSLSHMDLIDVHADEHHDQVHAIDGADHTGQLMHISLGGTDSADCHPTSAISGLDTELAGKLDNNYADFIPQAVNPPWQEGRVFYNAEKHCLSFYNDIADMTVDVPLEELIRVRNVSGATIANGKPVYVTGLSNSVMTIGLAQADTFSTSSVPGFTTHAIADGAYGFITHAGSVGGDMSAYSAGQVVYLSAVTAGEFTNVAPNIATKLGMVLNSAVDGSFQVKIESNIALPTLIGALNNGSAGVTISGTYVTIDNYSPVYQIGVPVNGPLGQITIPTVGYYRLNINFNIGFDDTGNKTAIVDLQLWNVTQGVEAILISSSLAKNSEGCALSPSFVYDFPVSGDVYELRVRSDQDLDNVNYQLVTIDLESVHLRA